MSNATEQVTVTISIDKAVYDQIERRAIKRHITVSEWVQELTVNKIAYDFSRELARLKN